MREHKIKETCSCGATFEYTETAKESWDFTDISRRQADFHKAHKNCREFLIPPKE